MKQLVLLCLTLLVGAVLASPIKKIPQNVDGNEKHYRWTLIPDDDGRMHLMDMDPSEVKVEPFFNAETDVIFSLFTQRNPTAGQIITWSNETMQNSQFDPSHPTRFLIHGWNGGIGGWNMFVIGNYLRFGQYNMIAVDWTAGGNTLNYITARNRVGEVARVMGSFIDFLHSFELIRFSELHIIGHSLGGQIAGLTGKAVRQGRIQVITALDPAGPLFSFSNPAERVANTDAVYVEVIHTNMGRLGFDQPIGDADFFPNWGVIMPGCESDITGQCSHSRAHHYYGESINSQFTSQECSSFNDILTSSCLPTGRTASMGGPFPKIGLTGVYFLTTNADAPFSRG